MVTRGHIILCLTTCWQRMKNLCKFGIFNYLMICLWSFKTCAWQNGSSLSKIKAIWFVVPCSYCSRYTKFIKFSIFAFQDKSNIVSATGVKKKVFWVGIRSGCLWEKKYYYYYFACGWIWPHAAEYGHLRLDPTNVVRDRGRGWGGWSFLFLFFEGSNTGHLCVEWLKLATASG